MEALTDRQEAVMQFIRVFRMDKGYPPTRAEIASHFGFKSTNAAEEHLQALAKKGVVRLTPRVSRGICLV